MTFSLANAMPMMSGFYQSTDKWEDGRLQKVCAARSQW